MQNFKAVHAGFTAANIGFSGLRIVKICKSKKICGLQQVDGHEKNVLLQS